MGQKSWYVLQSKPKKEQQVYKQLLTKSIEVYYPTLKVKPVNPRASKIRPFFPRYLFVHVDLSEVSIRDLRWLPGAIGVVQFGEHFATLPDEFVVVIKSRLQHLDEVGGPLFERLKQGDQVRITEGVFQGYNAFFDMRLNDNERVQLLLDMAGRSVRVDVEACFIKKI